MPLEIVGSLIRYISAQLDDLNLWDGETPRQDPNGNPINPSAGAASWPAVCLDMTDGGFNRTQMVGTDPYDDRGDVLIQVWGTGRAQVMAALNPLEALLVKTSNWNAITVQGGDDDNPPYVIKLLLKNWTCRQVPDVRLTQSQLCYLGRLVFDCDVHGCIDTQ